MRNNISTRLAALYILIAISLGGCDFSGIEEAVDNFDIVIELEPISTSSTVILTDAKTGELITENVKATFVGPNAGDVIDMYSDPMPSQTVQEGILTFGIKNTATPSASSPVQVQLVLQADGYQPSIRVVSITEERNNTFTFKMINESAPPAGVVSRSATEGQAGNAGTVQQDFQIALNSDIHPEASITLQVPRGIVFKDADGNSLTGELTTRLSYYDPTEPDVLESMPPEPITNDGATIYTAGAFAMQITDEQGRIAASSSSSVVAKSAHASNTDSLKLTIIADLINSPEREAMMTREEVQLYITELMGENGGISNPEFQGAEQYINALIEAWNDSLKMEIGYTDGITETGSNNRPYFIIGQLIENDRTCPTTVNLQRSGYSGRVKGSVFMAGFTRSLTFPAEINSYTIETIPDIALDYELETPYGTVSGSHNFCSGGDLDITLPPPPSNMLDATVQVGLQCQNPDDAVRLTNIPAASVVYRKADAEEGTTWRPATNLQWNYDETNQALTGGSFDIQGIEQGKEYTFKTVYDDKIYEKTIPITGESITYTETITDSICR